MKMSKIALRRAIIRRKVLQSKTLKE